MIRHKQGHLTVRSGKRVIVHLCSGKKIIAKFKEKHSRCVSFFDYEDVPLSDIRTLTIYRGKL